MEKLFKLFGFYDEAGELIDLVPSTDIEEAKQYFEDTNPNTKYMYIEVLN